MPIWKSNGQFETVVVSDLWVILFIVLKTLQLKLYEVLHNLFFYKLVRKFWRFFMGRISCSVVMASVAPIYIWSTLLPPQVLRTVTGEGVRGAEWGEGQGSWVFLCKECFNSTLIAFQKINLSEEIILFKVYIKHKRLT